MYRFLAVLSAVTFGIVILGISVIQVRGIAPGQDRINSGMVNPNSELSLYVADPAYLATVTRQNFRLLFTFDPGQRAAYLGELSRERFNLAQHLIATDRLRVGLWTWRKALIYQSRSLALFPKLDQMTQQELGRVLGEQIQDYGQLLESQALILRDVDLSDVNFLTAMLKDNTQALNNHLVRNP